MKEYCLSLILVFMHGSNCLIYFDSFACFFDDNVMRSFVAA